MMALSKTVLQDIIIFFQDVHLDVKIYWILATIKWNSTTVIMLYTDLKYFLQLLARNFTRKKEELITMSQQKNYTQL